jgi:hypothetical protein
MFWNPSFPIGVSPVSGSLAKRVPANRLEDRAQAFSLPEHMAGVEGPVQIWRMN